MTARPTPAAVLIDGRLVSATDHADAWLTPAQVAQRLGVGPTHVSHWQSGRVRRHRADGPHPYPGVVDGQHVVVDGQVRVLTSSLNAWVRAVAVSATTPDGVSMRGPAAAWAVRWVAANPARTEGGSRA